MLSGNILHTFSLNDISQFGVRFLLCLYVKKHVVVGNHSVMLRRTRDGAQIFFVAEKRFVPTLLPFVCFYRSYIHYI